MLETDIGETVVCPYSFTNAHPLALTNKLFIDVRKKSSKSHQNVRCLKSGLRKL